MRIRLVLLRPKPGQPTTSRGDSLDNFDPVAERWAEVVPVQGREDVVGRRIRASITHEVSIRWSPVGLDSTWKLQVKRQPTRFFEIVEALNVDERKREIKIGAMEHVQ